ncbi:MAG TPA: peptidase S41 [Planctomycetaceae bacterium]|nr:peptidase S41 [Planctomycetaceae bacterium]HRE99557.1 S41 family peptidase [Pirellulaceae bacterium]
MRSRHLFARLRRCASIALFALASAVPTLAQVRIPDSAMEAPADLASLWGDVEQLESQGRWGDVLSLLERARREYPRDAAIRERQVAARLQYDSRRRYADASFVRLVSTSDAEQTQRIYGEVLDKIETFHVDSPNWDHCYRTGVRSLLVTLRCDAFHAAHQVSPTADQLVALEGMVGQIARSARVTDRRSLERSVAELSTAVSAETGLPPSAVTMEFVCGATSSLDWYSSFLTGDQYDEVMSQIDGNFVGLGVELKPTDEYLEILSVIPNGPAGQAGIAAGDRIVEVDRIPVSRLGGNPAADRLRGEPGSTVILSVDPVGEARRELTLARRRVEIPSVEQARIADPENGVAYLKLSSFQRSTSQEVSTALWSLHRQGMKSLVIDLRGNPGGLLDAAVEVADLFLPTGTIVTTKGRNYDENRVHQAEQDGTWRMPLVVMIDGDSASASEILAGALRDNRRATVVGERSYGKGSVQMIFALNTCSAGMRLTTSKFFSPSGHAISDGGVEPDVAVGQQLVGTSAAPDRVALLRPNLEADPSLATALRVASRRLQPLVP